MVSLFQVARSRCAAETEVFAQMSFLAKLVKSVVIIAMVALISGCAKKEEDLSKLEPEEIYSNGMQLLSAGDFDGAAKSFSEIERLYPYSRWARQGTLQSARAYNRAGKYDESRGVAQRFLSFYPGDEYAAYAKYLVAMSYFLQMDKKGRDRANTVNALKELQELMEQYGESEFAKTAALKFDLAVDLLAAKEMEVGRYYLKRKNYSAAINRFKVVVNDLNTTTHTPEALHRLVESYLLLGLEEEAMEAAVLLGHNYQGSEWYNETYKIYQERGLDVPKGNPRENILKLFYRRTIKGEWL